MLLTTYASVSLANAFRLPFGWHLPWAHASEAHQVPLGILEQLADSEEVESTDHLNRIAIIGAGAGGSSSAFWIGKAKERWGLDLEVDLYDSRSYIGGSESISCTFCLRLALLKSTSIKHVSDHPVNHMQEV